MAEFPTASRQIGLGSFVVLPDCLIAYITCQLELRDVAALSCSSKLMHLFCCEEPLWLALCLRDTAGIFEFKTNWRQTALHMYTERTAPPEAVQLAINPVQAPADFASMFLYKRWYRCNVQLTDFVPLEDAIQRIEASDMSPEAFLAQFDSPCRPAILRGLITEWPAGDWALPSIATKYGSTTFKVSKPMGGACQMTFHHYLDYITRQHDEEPLYIFDDRFGERAPEMLKSYSVPHVFAQDFFRCLGVKRPPHRWLVLGPGRSGAGWHVDPSLTSAWNSLLSGRKRWALYPPGRTPPGVPNAYEGEDDDDHDSDLSALQWFLEVYPTLAPEDRPLEFVQYPGETVYVPGGWWHVVLNLETTVALTQNFVSEGNLQRVMEYMALGPEIFYHKHQAALEAHREEREAAAALAPWWAPVVQAGAQAPPAYLLPALQHLPSDYSPLEALLGVRFQRNRVLGRWLHQLCLAEPQLQDRIVQTGKEILGLDVWGRVLTDICTQLGVPPPRPHELFPWSGATSNVFMVGGVAIKIFCHESKAMAQLLCSSESFLYCVLASTSDEFSSATPNLLATGTIVHTPARLCIPFMVTTRVVGGQGLGEVIAGLPREDIRGTAEKLGNMVADLHGCAAARQPAARALLRSIPLLSVDVSDLEGSVPPEMASMAQVDPMVAHAAERLDDDGRLLDSTVGEMHKGSFFHDRDGNVWTSAHGLLVKSWEIGGAAEEEETTGEAGSAPAPQVPMEWAPFVQYLRHRCKRAAGELAGSGPLPRWLIEGMHDYLPADPALLLGLSPPPSSPPDAAPQAPIPKPCMLHGDLSSGNVLLALDGEVTASAANGTAVPAATRAHAAQVQVLDFADSGHGDPLYDLIALWHSCFRGHDGVMAVFLQSYRTRLARHASVAAAAAAAPRDSQLPAPCAAAGCEAGCGTTGPGSNPPGTTTPGGGKDAGCGTGPSRNPPCGTTADGGQDAATSHGDGLAAIHCAVKEELLAAPGGGEDAVTSDVDLLAATHCAIKEEESAAPGGGEDGVADGLGTMAAAQGHGGSGLPFWPSRGRLSLSYCAMCYTLLHEEHPLVDLFRLNTELWQVADMQQLQQRLWGFLDADDLPA